MTNEQPLTLVDLTKADEVTVRELIESANWGVDDRKIALYFALGKWIGCQQDGEIVGMVTRFSHGQNRWSIGNLIVHPSHQRRGIGQRLLDAVMDSVPKPAEFRLIATDIGYPLYLRNQFATVDQISRLVLERAESPCFDVTVDGTACITVSRDITKEAVAHLASLETSATGVTRPTLYECLRHRPDVFLLTDIPQIEQASAFAICYEGLGGMRLGPVIADDLDNAQLLISTAFKALRGTVFLDVPVSQNEFRDIAMHYGFQESRRSPWMSTNSLAGPLPPKQFALHDPALL